MTPRIESTAVVCKRCGASENTYESAYDAIRAGWRLRRIGDAVAKDYQWLCVECAQSERPPAVTLPGVDQSNRVVRDKSR